jgi:uncharacterized membrane protein
MTENSDIFFNGMEVGAADRNRGRRRFEVNVPAELVKSGEKNQMTIRVYNAMGEGGIGSPIVLGTESEFAPQFEAKLATPNIKVAGGGKSRIKLRISNKANEKLRGEVWLTSPHEAWRLFSRHRVSFSAPPLGTAEVEYPVAAPADFTPGDYWAIFKVTANDKFVFSDTLAITVGK